MKLTLTHYWHRFTKLKHLLLIFLFLGFGQTLMAQIFYKTENYVPNTNYPFHPLGRLFNSEPYLLTNIPTLYYENKNVYATAYLPFIQTEYNPDKPVVLYGPHYTTGIALASPKNLAYQLYAPIQVALFSNFDANLHAFAAIIPDNENENNYQGPFDVLPYLNDPPINFQSPIPGVVGVSALEIVQKFTKFTHDMFPDNLNDPLSDGWNGIDKGGNKTINVVINSDDPNGKVAEYFHSLNRIVLYKTHENDYTVTRSLIGHEITHGIVDNVVGYDHTLESAAKREINEAFSDIMGVSFANWLSPGQFETPNWVETPEFFSPDVEGTELAFNNSKLFSLPNTYQGQFYKNPNDEGYRTHINGSVLKFWFYLLNNQHSGRIDDDENKPFYATVPLILGNKEASYKLALRVLFKTFTEKLLPTDGYPELKVKTLETLTEMGYPSSSIPYFAMSTAWFAVGLAQEQDLFNTNCGVIKSAASWYNGQSVAFPVKEFTGQLNPQSPFGYKLIDCISEDKVYTSEYTIDYESITYWDQESDDIYGIGNDLNKSKSAVGVHAFSVEARNWFNEKFNYNGTSEPGLKEIENILGHPNYLNARFNHADSSYYYPFTPETSNIDAVTQTFFQGINFYAKNDSNLVQDYAHAEWEAIRNGLAQIFALNIKNDYKATLPGMYTPVWTLGEDVPNNPNYFDFENPGLSNQPKLFKGNHWDNIYPAKNASLLSFWYYLLVQGTDGYGPQGYQNEKEHFYTIFPQDKAMVLEVIWKAYRELMPVFGTIEDFRFATLDVAQQTYGSKSKQYIAFYDAWSAVMDYTDFTATLAHEPSDLEPVYPWPVKLGVQVEYPLYESSRVFEVSESPTFDEQVATVLRFLNDAAPDLETSMVYGTVYLEKNKTYFVRSHLVGSGELLKGGCAESDDPAFCEALKGKQKWTAPFSLVTSEVISPSELLPASGSVAPAWKTPFSWEPVLNANGYSLKVTDLSGAGAVPMQTLEDQTGYDPDVPLVQKVLALSREKQYSWSVAGKQKLGSEKAVKRILEPTGKISYELLTPQERADFSDIYGTWSNPITFKTDLPKVVLGDPADGTKVSMLAFEQPLKALQWDSRGDFFRLDFFLNGDFQEPKWTKDFTDEPSAVVSLDSQDFLLDHHNLGWTFTSWKLAVDPFIPKDEPGETHTPFHFRLDRDLIPSPVLHTFDCVNTTGAVSFKWNAVAGAKGYEFRLKNLTTNTLVGGPVITALTELANVAGGNVYPGSYEWSVAAGIQDMNGQWVFGPPAKGVYAVRPPAPANLAPSNGLQNVVLGDNQSLTFSWAGSGPFLFSLSKEVNGGLEKVVENKSVNGTAVTINNLEYGAHYFWSVAVAGGPANCSVGTPGDFHTQPPPFVPELGFNFTLVDCDKDGLCLKDIKYNITVTAPNGNTVFSSNGLFSNTAGITYSPNSSGVNNGELPIMSGIYTVTVMLVQIGPAVPAQPSKPAWLFSVHSMDIFPLLNSFGEAIEMDVASQAGQVNPVLNTTIKIKFKYNADTQGFQAL